MRHIGPRGAAPSRRRPWRVSSWGARRSVGPLEAFQSCCRLVGPRRLAGCSDARRTRTHRARRRAHSSDWLTSNWSRRALRSCAIMSPRRAAQLDRYTDEQNEELQITLASGLSRVSGVHRGAVLLHAAGSAAPPGRSGRSFAVVTTARRRTEASTDGRGHPVTSASITRASGIAGQRRAASASVAHGWPLSVRHSGRFESPCSSRPSR